MRTTILRTPAFLAILFFTASGFAADDKSDSIKRTTVAPLAELVFYPEESAPAETISRHNSRIVSQITATVSRINVLVGDLVKQGETLVELDCTDARLSMDTARAQLSLAEKEAERARALRKTSNIAEQNYNQTLTNLNLAKIGLEQSRVQVGRCKVTAPYEGIVTARHASQGELATPGKDLVQLVSTEEVEVSAKIPVTRNDTLNDSAATPTFHFQGTVYPVVLRALLPIIDPASNNIEARFDFQGQVSPVGSSGRLVWQIPAPHIPADLLVTRGEQTGIFLLDDTHAKFLPLPNATVGKPALLSLPENTLVIQDGRYSLRDGDLVEVLN